MLSALSQRLICPTCKQPGSELHVHAFREGTHGHVADGVLVCSACRAWYPIEDDLLEFVPRPMLYQDDLAAFERRFASALTGLGLQVSEGNGGTSNAPDPGGEDFSEQRTQREHFDRYAEGGEPGFKDYTQSVFIRAASSRFVRLWREQMTKPGTWLLDVGCGNGISSFPFTDRQIVAGFDISKKAVRRATEEARTRGVMANATFFVGDGSFLAFKDASFGYAQTFGSLHHLPNPGQAVKDIVRILEPGGIYFGVENNQTAFRWIFDLMMKLKPLWVEEAGAEPLISEAMIRGWAAGLPVRVHCETSVFLPPHLFNLMNLDRADAVLDASDRAFLHVPWLRANGGQIIYHMHKQPVSGRAAA